MWVLSKKMLPITCFWRDENSTSGDENQAIFTGTTLSLLVTLLTLQGVLHSCAFDHSVFYALQNGRLICNDHLPTTNREKEFMT